MSAAGNLMLYHHYVLIFIFNVLLYKIGYISAAAASMSSLDCCLRLVAYNQGCGGIEFGVT